MRLPHIIVVVSCVLGAAPVQGQSRVASSCDLPHAAGVSVQRLVSGQRKRAYRLFVPPEYDRRERLPLVLDLHGSGATAAGQARTSGFETLSVERFLVATLAAEDARWNVPVQAAGRTTSPTSAT